MFEQINFIEMENEFYKNTIDVLNWLSNELKVLNLQDKKERKYIIEKGKELARRG